MSCVECNITERVFPQDVITSCTLKEGFKETNISSFIRGWGGKSLITSKYIIEAKFLIPNSESFLLFEKWYLEEVQNGALDFTIKLPIRGLERDWIVKFTQHYEVLDRVGTGIYILCKFEVLDNVDEYINQADCNICT